MSISMARVGQLLLGEDSRRSAAGVAIAVGLFAGLLLDAVLGVGFVDWLPNPLLTLSVAGVVLAAACTYVNEGLLVAMCLAVAPVYAFWIEVLHQGMISPSPYPQAAVEALRFGLLGTPGGLLGAMLGLAARRVVE